MDQSRVLGVRGPVETSSASNAADHVPLPVPSYVARVTLSGIQAPRDIAYWRCWVPLRAVPTLHVRALLVGGVEVLERIRRQLQARTR
jgi:hypothetical protein